jgi:hypothetical protein
MKNRSPETTEVSLGSLLNALNSRIVASSIGKAIYPINGKMETTSQKWSLNFKISNLNEK